MRSTPKILVLITAIFLFTGCAVNKVKSQMSTHPLTYTLSMSNPNTHLFEVKMNLDLNLTKPGQIKNDYIDVKMAAWTPGSYLMREYAKNVEGFSAKGANGALKSKKISKNTWRIELNGQKKVEVNYEVYAYELTVRTSHLDDSHGYVNGAAVFMFISELMNEASTLKVEPHKSFKTVSTALPETTKNTYIVEDFDTLVDSPIEIGNQEILNFEAEGVKYTIANYSLDRLDYNREKVIEDYKKVVTNAHKVIGGTHPCKEYLFIVHHLPNIGGGLEHLYSTTCQTSPETYTNPARYQGFLGLLAHEYFHLWNVKRIRPEALGPFDYEVENYTNMLWVSEGFTSFYQDDILRRAGLIDEETFLKSCQNRIGTIENLPGNSVQSVTESSWDAWIKYYRPNENSNNSTVSYYTKGGVLGSVLNLIIIGETKGEKSLDDVMSSLYNTIYLKENRGYSDDEFRKTCEKISGVDLSSFFENQIYGVQPIDYAKYFDKAGITFTVEEDTNAGPWMGVSTRGNRVTRVEKGSGAYLQGIYVTDEILTVNGKKFTSDDDFTDGKKVGDKIKVGLLRSGKTFEYEIDLVKNPKLRRTLVKRDKLSEVETKCYNKFMHL
jgi:predicted metalloprotease with PDZ domain